MIARPLSARKYSARIRWAGERDLPCWEIGCYNPPIAITFRIRTRERWAKQAGGVTIPILVGASCFLLMIASERARARGFVLAAAASRFAIYLVFAASLVALLLMPPALPIALAWRVAAALIALPFLFLLILSHFLEPRSSRPHLTEEGTYALCRHPGVLWLFALQASLAFAAASLPLLAALPIWTLLNVILAAAEDRSVFPELFGDAYAVYRQRTPFLVPNTESFRRCVASFGATRPNPRLQWKKTDAVKKKIQGGPDGRAV
jgi:protein-S-isoprenylcysteine O-methyltransferase Ste14